MKRAYFTVEGTRQAMDFCDKVMALGYRVQILFPPVGMGYMVCWSTGEGNHA